MAGCQTPATRAREHPVAFERLSPADRRLVLHGKVRPGLPGEAVVIAWGEPACKVADGTSDAGKDHPAEETWIYQRQLAVHAPIGSYDQWQPGSSLVAPGAPLVLSPGFGFGGAGYEGWLLCRPHVQPTGSYVRRVFLVNGRLAAFHTWYGELPPL